jgi:hypothetical protein
MKKLYFSLFFFILNFTAFADTEKPLSVEAKKKISLELSALQNDLDSIKGLVWELRADKLNMKYTLEAMENWGVSQQEDKDKYYAESLEAEVKVASVQRQVDLEKANKVELLAKYRRVKQVLSYICGALFLCLYLNFGAPILRTISSLTMGWGVVLGFATPMLAFVAGYVLIYFIF